MGLSTAHEAAVVAGAKALHEAGVVGDRMSMAETVVTALAADPEVWAAVERAVDIAVTVVVCEPHCSPHLHGRRLALDAVSTALA